MDVRELVKIGLRQGGYDGLWSADGECGCVVDDLSPGDCMTEHCKAGHRTPCPSPDYDCDGDCGWHIGEKGGG